MNDVKIAVTRKRKIEKTIELVRNKERARNVANRPDPQRRSDLLSNFKIE